MDDEIYDRIIFLADPELSEPVLVICLEGWIDAGLGANLVNYPVEARGRFASSDPVLDQLWAVAPFLLLPEIGVGLAFAATAALLYVPFSERTLVRLGYRDNSS